MIDLIIPYYNNPKGLSQTLRSIDYNLFNVIVIDDGSDMPLLPPYNAHYQYWRHTVNQGPGKIRQYGIDHTSNPYIMFIDTGDMFISKEIQQEIIDTVKDNPAVNLFTWQYYHYSELSKSSDNRLHGKVYRRSFLDEYEISFCGESSYLNEDIGFNRTCKAIIDANHLLQMRIDKPTIQQIKDNNSLTQKDGQMALYKDQTRALSLVSIHTVETLQKNNIDAQEEINLIAMALYYWFIRTAAERIEFLPRAWEGAKIFYTKYKKEIKPNLLINGNAYLKRCLSYRHQLHFPINVLKFAHEILVDENLPSYYLT